MIDQAKEVAQRLRTDCGNPMLTAKVCDTIDALVLEVERLTKQNNTITEAYELEAAECSRYAEEAERIATVMQATVDAKEAADRFIKSKVEPNYDHVICPGCCHQFRAIPVNVQDELAALRAENERLKKQAIRATNFELDLQRALDGQTTICGFAEIEEVEKLKDDIADLMRDERYNELEAENKTLRAENEQWQSKWSAMEEASIRQFQRVVKLAEERDTLQQENEMLKAEKMLDYTSLYDKYSDALAEVQELRVQREQAQADAVRYRWLRDNNAVVLECTFQRKGYRSTAPDAQRETWYEHEGWIVSTMPITTEAFGTMDAAIDAAREVIEKEDDREYCPRCNEQWSGTSCGIPNCGWVKGDIDE